MNINNQTFDVIIVGSGPGGATVARDLAKAGKKVLILERGNNAKLKGVFWHYLLYQCIPFQSMLFTSQLLGMVRGLITGGSSIFYYGTCFPVPFKMLETYGVDIRREVEELRKELPIAPLRDDVMGPKAKCIMESAKALGYEWKKLDKFMYQDRFDPNQHPAHYYYGDPRKVKWSARLFVEEALEYGAVLQNRAKVKKVLVENGKAVGVEFTHWGRKRTVYASKIVIAAGGIGSPTVLRNSGIRHAGYDFFFDPLISVVGYIDGIETKPEIPMSAGMHVGDEGYVMTDMALPKMLDMIFTLSAFRFHRVFSQKKAVRIMVKIRDDLGGRIGEWGGIRKRLTKADKQKLKSGYRRAKAILKNAGAKEVFKTWKLAAHPGGSAKIGEVVDADLKTQFDNLYVCDCSVIPEAWGLPPTLTILGLARKLSKHLLGRASASSTQNKNQTLRMKPYASYGNRPAVTTGNGFSDIVVKVVKTEEIRTFISKLAPDILNIWAGRNLAKQAIAVPAGKIISNGFAGEKALEDAKRAATLFGSDAFLHRLGQELPALVDGVLDLARAMAAHLETLPVEQQTAYLAEVFNSPGHGVTGEILTSLFKMVDTIHRENPLFFSEHLGAWFKTWMEHTNFGELKDAVSGSSEDVAALVASVMDTLLTYPAKLVVLFSLIPDGANMLLKSVRNILKALGQLSPDLLTDVVLSLVRAVDGKSVGELINEVAEFIRKVHTGNALLGEPNNPQMPRDLSSLLDQVIGAVDTPLVLKSAVMLEDLVTDVKHLVSDAVNRDPDLQRALFQKGFSNLNARTQELGRKAQLWEDMLDEGRLAQEAEEGIKEIDAGDMADVVNRICMLLNQTRPEAPDMVRSLLNQFFSALDVDEIAKAATWFTQDAVDALKPVARDIMPPMIKGLAELLTPAAEDENGEELGEALASLRKALLREEAIS